MKKIAIVGDIMVDEYLSGKVNRVSPEAPIPIVSTDGKKKYVPGGCGNVANNISALGGKAVVFSLCGKDEDGRKLIEILEDNGIEYNAKLILGHIKTIVKQRIIGNGQQIVRIDCNDKPAIHNEDRDLLLDLFKEQVNEFSAVAISDYAKGICDSHICSSVISICQKKHIPVIVDPKGKNWDKYKGAFLITPNMKEIRDYSGVNYENEDKSIEQFSESYFSKIGVDNLLITRSEKGMTLFSNNSHVKHYKSLAKDVFDVSGAGDTVVATIAAILVENGYDLDNAIDYANTAAGIVVGKVGTSTVTREEIENERKGRSILYTPVIGVDDLEELTSLVDRWRKDNLSIVTTNGCFDVIHYGHTHLLCEAKKMGDKLIVCINSDASIKRLKGNDRPINSVENRALVLSAIKYVDAVVVFDEIIQGSSNTDVPFAVLKTILPDVHVKGGDYSIDEVPEAKYAKRFETVSFISGCSTTNTISKIKSNNN